MSSCRSLSTVFSVLLLAAATVHGQSPETNRRALHLSVVPDPAGGPEDHQLMLHWAAESNPTSAPRDLSAAVEWRLNGVTIDSTPQVATLNFATSCAIPGGACSTDICGDWNDGASAVDGFCRTTPPTGECKCGALFITFGPSVPLSPGDEIMVILYPAPGALPDGDTSDDILLHAFDGTGVAPPSRILEDVTLQTSAAGDQFFDIWIDISVETGPSSVPLDLTTVVALVDATGNTVASTSATAIANPTTPCGLGCNNAFCGTWDDGAGTIGGFCRQSPVVDACSCAALLSVLIPAVPLQPQDELWIILYPAPGALPDPMQPAPQALPELPGFGTDFNRGDCNVDGAYALPDPIFLLNELFNGGPSGSCEDACDVNDDGFKSLADAIYMLAGLFQMGAPPAEPHIDCGLDPTADALGCDEFDPCVID